jgi:lipopolysaccharide export system protein LptA
MDQPLLIQRENILLLNADKEIIQKPSADPAQAVEKRKNAMKATQAITGGWFWAIAAGQLESIERNIKTRAFYEKAINNKGELHHGFAYFILNDLAVLSNNAKIQVMAKNINTEAITTFVFDFDMAAIKEEIKRRKEEDSKRKF